MFNKNHFTKRIAPIDTGLFNLKNTLSPTFTIFLAVYKSVLENSYINNNIEG